MRMSHSRIKLWLRCRRAHWYKYVRHLKKRVKRRPLMIGSIIHDMRKSFYKGRDPWEVLARYDDKYKTYFLAEQEHYGDIIGNARKIMTAYFDKYRDEKLSYIERRFMAPLIEDIWITGLVDGIKPKRFAVIDTKSSSKEKSDIENFINVQSAIYMHFVKAVGWLRKVEVMIWEYIKSSPPAIPEMTQKGGMSKRQIDTTWTVYKQALLDNDLDPNDYRDMEEKLGGKEDSFIKRVEFPYNPVAVKSLVRETQLAALEIRRRKKDNHRTIDRHCSWCDYQALCQAELLGEDTEHLLRTEYTTVRGGI